jgi:hypothetical protein
MSVILALPIVNLLASPDDFTAAAWTRYHATIAPSGGVQKLVEDATSEIHQVYQGILATDEPYTFSVEVKSAGRRWIFIREDRGNSQGVFFDIVNGTLGSVSAGYAGEIIALPARGPGWWRCSVTVPITQSSIYMYYSVVQLVANDGSTLYYTGDGVSGVYLSNPRTGKTTPSVTLPNPQRMTEKWVLFQKARRSSTGDWVIYNDSAIRRKLNTLVWERMQTTPRDNLLDFVRQHLRGMLKQCTLTDWDGAERLVRLSKPEIQHKQVFNNRHSVTFDLEGDV